MKVAVMMGGVGSEREVSLQSGLAVIDALRRSGLEARGFDPGEGGWIEGEREDALRKLAVGKAPPSSTGVFQLRKMVDDLEAGTADLAFLVLHGRGGEDGTIQAILEQLGIPYTGSDAAASSVAIDKRLTKLLLRESGIPTPRWWDGSSSLHETMGEIGFPCVVKPTREGSSVGVKLVRSPGELHTLLTGRAAISSPVLVETFLPGREFSVGVLGEEVLEPGEIVPQGSELFDYASKYQVGGAKEIFPAEIDGELRGRLRELAMQVHQCLKLRDYSRVDFRLDVNGKPQCLEVNTLPGMTPFSLLPRSAAAAGISFEELCSRMVDLALARSSR
ncbi:MAG: D-alanine--D-alanine ligase [Puniceicoccaceae bacterium]